MGVAPRAVVVTRPTDFDLLLLHHATREQARFFLDARGQSIEAIEARHRSFENVRRAVLAAVPESWRVARVTRDDLDRFLFEPSDVVVALGQDGLVANVAKYLDGQLVIGLNPDLASYEGVLVRHPPDAAGRLFATSLDPVPAVEERTLVECVLDDGQRVLALNEVYLGHRSHQTARYLLRVGSAEERQMSSGLVVTTGTGATGWARSICRQRSSPVRLPEPSAPSLAFLVREAFPSPRTGADLTAGGLGSNESLLVTSEMNDGGTVFGDGIEADNLDFPFGATATVRVASERLRLLLG